MLGWQNGGTSFKILCVTIFWRGSIQMLFVHYSLVFFPQQIWNTIKYRIAPTLQFVEKYKISKYPPSQMPRELSFWPTIKDLYRKDLAIFWCEQVGTQSGQKTFQQNLTETLSLILTSLACILDL